MRAVWHKVNYDLIDVSVIRVAPDKCKRVPEATWANKASTGNKQVSKLGFLPSFDRNPKLVEAKASASEGVVSKLVIVPERAE